MVKSSPERSCLVCRGRGPKSEFLRFVVRERELCWDKKHNLPGRGAYLHRRNECLLKAGDAKRWEKALRMDDITGTLANLLKEVIKWGS